MRIFVCRHSQYVLKQMLDCVEKCVKQTGGMGISITDLHEKTVLLHEMQAEAYEWAFIALDLRREHNREKIERIINVHLGLGNGEENQCIWFFNREKISLNVDDIYYFYSYQRITKVCTYAAEYRINTTLSEQEKALERKGFIRVHQGYLVQKNRIRLVTKYSLTLKNGVVVPVSRQYRQKLRSLP